MYIWQCELYTYVVNLLKYSVCLCSIFRCVPRSINAKHSVEERTRNPGPGNLTNNCKKGKKKTVKINFTRKLYYY